MDNYYKKWTGEDLEILRKFISKKGVIEGSKLAAEELKRSSYACRQIAYNHTASGKWKAPKRGKINQPEVLECLKRNVKEHPDNLKTAFDITSKETGLSSGSLQAFWYSKGHPLSRESVGFCFLLGSNKKVTINTKNSGKTTLFKFVTKRIKRIVIKLFNIQYSDL